ncbi:hypothetical protein EV421DRAFT_1924671 [Armillaria borealis]|uniref:3-beta hydroxysteroid dehydrogenase/isomerase domain-containing protein n=1 Tax=Armillaria borealis TaxID=47425 RepID=A0AA39MFS7_9AGAR|nr:hypothetical protein EV421DRAFT_1924671 [Armillaria borealis]
MASECELAAPSIDDQLPPKTGRRYIVVGGAGFLGGWIVLQLLRRGEDPKRIRILHIRPSRRLDLFEGKAKDVKLLQVDISDKMAVDAAFSQPWPDNDESPISVNAQGAENIIDTCQKVGASVLVHTSSGSVSVHSSCFLLWPWQEKPKHFVQVINDDDKLIPKAHKDFFSNYGYTKRQAEVLVRGANDADGLRTGCLRPGNDIFGAGGDILCGAYLVRKSNLHGYRTSSRRSYMPKIAHWRRWWMRSKADEIERLTDEQISAKLISTAIFEPTVPAVFKGLHNHSVRLGRHGTNFPVQVVQRMHNLSSAAERDSDGCKVTFEVRLGGMKPDVAPGS